MTSPFVIGYGTLVGVLIALLVVLLWVSKVVRVFHETYILLPKAQQTEKEREKVLWLEELQEEVHTHPVYFTIMRFIVPLVGGGVLGFIIENAI